MNDQQGRTRFGASPTNMNLIRPAAVAALVLAVAGIYFIVDGAAYGVVLILLGLGLGYVAYRGWSAWSKPYSVEFGPAGIAFEVRGRTFDLPWEDIESLEYGNPYARGKPSAVVQLLARPARHVGDPTAEPRGVLWSRRGNAWVICEPHQIDGTREELDAALARFAGGRAQLE